MTTAYEIADGIVITKAKRRNRFVLIDGEIRQVDGDFDRRVLSDPESAPRALATKPPNSDKVDAVLNLALSNENVHSIASAILKACPNGLVAVAQNSKDALIAATVTHFVKRLTAATFRKALRGLPIRCKSVTFAACAIASPDVRDAATIAAECHLITISDFIIVD